MRRFRTIVIALVTLAMSTSLVACAVPDQEQTGSGQGGVEHLVFAGSGTCKPLIEELSAEYARQNPGVVVEFLPGTHSSGGVAAAASRTAQVGMVSRPLKPEEEALGLEYEVLSDDGLVIACDSGLGVDSLTSQQVRDIYSGKADNWSEVGGPDKPIVVLDRNEDESAKIILRKYVLDEDGPLDITERSVILYYEPEMANAVEKTEGAIGYFSLGFATVEALAATIVKLDGVEPSVENVLNGTYEMVRPLGIVYQEDVDPIGAGFVSYAKSAEAADRMAARGFAPAQR